MNPLTKDAASIVFSFDTSIIIWIAESEALTKASKPNIESWEKLLAEVILFESIISQHLIVANLIDSSYLL